MKKIIQGLILMILGSIALPLAASTEMIVSSDSEPHGAQIRITSTQPLQPRIRFLSQDNCWQFDFTNVTISPDFKATAPICGPIRLIQASLQHENPLIQRLSVHVRPGTEMKCLKDGQNFKIVLKSPPTTGFPPKVHGYERQRQPLLSPQPESTALALNLKKEPTLSLIDHLTQLAGMKIRFRDIPPSKITIDGRFSSPEAALQMLARQMNMVLSSEADGWWLSNRSNSSSWSQRKSGSGT